MSTLPDRALLARWLLAYRPLDAREAEHREHMLALLDTSGDPFRRDHFQPGHFTASGFVRAPEGERLLLIHHAKLQRWLQPGGHVDAVDADLRAAAVREVTEETGVALRASADEGIFDVDVHEIPASGDEPVHRHFDVRFAFVAADERLRRGSDVRDVRWVSFADVATLESDESVARAVRKLAPEVR